MGVGAVTPSVVKSKADAELAAHKMYERAMASKEKQDKLREDARKGDATFTPQLVSSKRLRERTSTPGKARHEVLFQEAAARAEALKAKAASPSDVAACTFSPQTNRRASAGAGGGARLSLYEQAKVLELKRKQQAEKLLRAESEALTFKP